MESSPLLNLTTSNRSTIIITGGNSGLGLECAKALYASSKAAYHIVLACRNLQAASAAVQQLQDAQGCHHRGENRSSLEAMQVDLASLESVRHFANVFAERRAAGTLPPLRSLVLNAGLQVVTGRSNTQDGFETTFGVNHLGHFLLVNLLLRHLSAPARVIFVSSDTHDPAANTGMPVPQYATARQLANPTTADIGNDVALWGRRAYTTSKLCNVLCAYELGRRLQRSGIDPGMISVAAFNPGMMPGTGLARDYSGPMRFGWNYILPVATWFSSSVRTPSNSGASLARLATDRPDIAGKYFDGDAERRSSEESYNEAKAQDLWCTSMELVRLEAAETLLPIG